MPFLFPNNLLSEGMRSAVSCQILQGNLPITFTWTDSSGRPLTSAGISVRANDEYSSTLVIDSLSYDHSGNYSCTAENEAGKASHTAELTVKVPPKWLFEPEDVRAVEGQDVLIPCSVRGFPEPTTVWTKHSGFVDAYETLSLTSSQFSNGSLFIPGVSKQSQGQYTCTAENGVRSTLTKTINLTVIGKNCNAILEYTVQISQCCRESRKVKAIGSL